MMTVNLGEPNHATAFPSKMLATSGGKHIYSIKAGSDTDNGFLVAAGKMIALDVYEEAAVTKFTGEVALQMPDGRWLVSVTDPGDACLVYTEPKIPYESPSNEAYFYNKKGDLMTCLEFAKGDAFAVNEAAFNGTPSKGAKVTGATGRKMTIGN